MYFTPKHPSNDSNMTIQPNKIIMMPHPRKKLGSNVPQSETIVNMDTPITVTDKINMKKLKFKRVLFTNLCISPHIVD